MRESVIYQEILERMRQEGERSLILRLLACQAGKLLVEMRRELKLCL